jgi:hypothetical protein
MTNILNVPKSIREDDKNDHKEKEKENDDDDDLIFGSLDDEKSPPSTDEGIHLHSNIERTKKRERTHSSLSNADDEWENILPITESDGPINRLQSINEKNSNEQIIGMSNFRAKHRLRRRSKPNTFVRWSDAVKKVVQLKDPW